MCTHTHTALSLALSLAARARSLSIQLAHRVRCSRTLPNARSPAPLYLHSQKLYEHTFGKRTPVSPHACTADQCTGVETTEIAHYEIVYSAMDQTCVLSPPLARCRTRCACAQLRALRR